MELLNLLFALRYTTPATLPEWKGNFIRGLVGKYLWQVSCTQKRKRCENCNTKCPYYFLYESEAPKHARHLTKLEGIPRPFVIDETPISKSNFEPGEELNFGLVLVGSAIRYLPHIVTAVKLLGENGMSLAPYPGQFEIGKILAKDIGGNPKELYVENKLSLSFPTINARDIFERATEHPGTLCLHFLTPTQLKAGGNIETPPGFRTLVSRLVFRINALSNYYTNRLCIPERNLKHLLNEANSVSIADTQIEIIPEFIRISHEKVTKHKMFFRGNVYYGGNFSRELMGIIELGSLLHVGKFAAFGCGKYTVLR
jgi:hypothetical protein